jgi:hypothetical protein
MFVSTEKARRELGFAPDPVATALERAVRWYQDHGYVRGEKRARITEERAA